MSTLKWLLALITATLLSLAAAHAVVRTESGLTESKVGASETYRLQVPAEKELATTLIRLVVPAGVRITRFLPVPGFTRAVKTDSSNQITEVIWTGPIQPLEFQRFVFIATNPAEAGTSIWKVYQTYADGSVVSWDDSAPTAPASKVTLK